MKTPIQSDKVVYVDCDDTLVMWDTSEYATLRFVDINLYDYTNLAINQKNVNLAIKLSKLGYIIIVWSQTGWQWAQAVGKAVGLDRYVALYLSKPRYHMDDMPASAWVGERLWRDPITGKSWNKT